VALLSAVILENLPGSRGNNQCIHISVKFVPLESTVLPEPCRRFQENGARYDLRNVPAITAPSESTTSTFRFFRRGGSCICSRLRSPSHQLKLGAIVCQYLCGRFLITRSTVRVNLSSVSSPHPFVHRLYFRLLVDGFSTPTGPGAMATFTVELGHCLVVTLACGTSSSSSVAGLSVPACIASTRREISVEFTLD
jgi:hypothetical protein